MKRILKEEVLEKVLKEIEDLQKHFKILDCGKGSEEERGVHVGSMKRRRKDPVAEVPKAVHTKEAIEASCQAVHTWLTSPESALRSVMHIMSHGGALYVGACAEKMIRAYVRVGPGQDVQQFKNACVKRAHNLAQPTAPSSASTAASSDVTGGF